MPQAAAAAESWVVIGVSFPDVSSQKACRLGRPASLLSAPSMAIRSRTSGGTPPDAVLKEAGKLRTPSCSGGAIPCTNERLMTRRLRVSAPGIGALDGD